MIDQAFQTAKKKETKQGLLQVGHYPDGREIQLPFSVYRGSSDGPTLWLNALIHGDEVNGAMTAMRTLAAIRPLEVRGTVVVTPLAHPPAFQFRQKTSPIDGLDLGTCFPGRTDGMLTQRIAGHLFEAVSKYANYLIDFHTVGSHYEGVIYTVFRQFAELTTVRNRAVKEMALAFGAPFNCRIDVGKAVGELAGTTTGSLDANCIQAGIPAFMAEIGSGGCVDEPKVRQAVQNVLKVMAHLGMIDYPGEDEASEQLIISKRRFLYSDHAGIFIPAAVPGVDLRSRDTIGEVVTFNGADPRTIQADVDSCLIVTRENAIVGVGDRVAIIGEEWSVLS